MCIRLRAPCKSYLAGGLPSIIESNENEKRASFKFCSPSLPSLHDLVKSPMTMYLPLSTSEQKRADLKSQMFDNCRAKNF